MKILNLYVTGQSVTLQGAPTIVSGSENYLGLRFEFGNDWEQYEKAYRFIWQEKAFTALEESGIVIVPREVIKPPYFVIAVGGYNGAEIVPTAGLKIPVTENEFGEPAVVIDDSESATVALLGQIFSVLSTKVPKTREIAGIDLQDDITKQELLEALNVEDGAEANDVVSVAGKAGAVVLDKNDVGLSNVDNTSDENKPLSAAGRAVDADLQQTKVDVGRAMQGATAANNRAGAIEQKIPEQASSENKLADKNFVNSSIATETAHYISDNGEPFTDDSDLPTDDAVTNNDYAFVTGTDSAGNTFYDRYKATVSGSTVTWAKEYRLNNSSFTSAQWMAISSGITAVLVGKLSDIDLSQYYTKTEANELLNDKVDKVNGKGLSSNDYDNTEKGKVASAYQKPQTGIPESDLSEGVQTKLNDDLAKRINMYGKDVTPSDDSFFSFSCLAFTYKGADAVENIKTKAKTRGYIYKAIDSGTIGTTAVEAGDYILMVNSQALEAVKDVLSASLPSEYMAALNTCIQNESADTPVPYGYEIRGNTTKSAEEFPEEMVIPYEHEGLPVVEIINTAFFVTPNNDGATLSLPNLKSVILPKTIRRIGNHAFRNSGLYSIEIPDSVVAIGDCVFAGCSNLKEITIPDSVVSATGTNLIPTDTRQWFDRSFQVLTSETAPDDWSTNYTNYYTKSGNTYTKVPEGTEPPTWAESTYYQERRCEALETVVLGTGLSYISWGMFYRCGSNLKTIKLLGNVTSDLTNPSDWSASMVQAWLTNCPNVTVYLNKDDNLDSVFKTKYTNITYTYMDEKDKQDKPYRRTLTAPSTLTVADNTVYYLSNVSSLSISYPTGHFECLLQIATASSGSVSISLPNTTKYIGAVPTLSTSETWEISIRDGVVVFGKVGT